MLNTTYTHDTAATLHVRLTDAIDAVIDAISVNDPPRTEAPALRDMINHDLPRIIRQVEQESVDPALAEVHQIARAEQAKRQAAAAATMEDEPMHTPLEHAEHLLALVDDLGIADMVRDAQPTLDTACFDLTQSHDLKVRALGYTLGLTAVLETPGALEQAVRALRVRLSEGLPVV
jgi:hypothetical protein